MKPTKENGVILKEYVKLARKLGKLPSAYEIQRFICSERQVKNNFSSFKALKELALQTNPELNDIIIPQKLTFDDLNDYKLELEKKKVDKKNNTTIDELLTMTYIERFAKNVFEGKITAGKKISKNFIDQRTHTLMLSDLHFGADIKGAEAAGHNYGTIEESRRFAAIIKAASEYKPQYRKNTKLVIAALGDFIENMMHDSRTGDVLSLQICRAVHLLTQGIAYLANSYESIQVEWSTGNHDRITSRHPKRAVHQKFDSYATVIAYSVKMALKNVPNVKHNIPKQVYGVYEVYGKKIGYTHGDSFIKPGNPYTSVNVKMLENQINKINAALVDKDELSAFLYGHTHIGHMIYLSNGCTLIGNGGLPPADHFAVSIGSLETNNGQWIFESVPGYPVGDARYLRAGKESEEDESLDKIIRPFTELND